MHKICFALIIALLVGCQSAYYGAAEKIGYHKRNILVDRVEDSREAQQDAEEQFQSALDQLSELTNFDGGDLEDVYDNMADEYNSAEKSADEVRERIKAVENVAEALFEEWQSEIEEYGNTRFKADSQTKLRETRQRYDAMITAMHSSEVKMDPVLAALKDNVLYLKHNLNARAVASLKIEFQSIKDDIESLITEMRKAIASSDAFIAEMQ